MYFSINKHRAIRSHLTRLGQTRQWRKRLARPGLTLVELLVVVTILMILLGVVLPLASPSLKGRKIREAARQVNTAFSGAKSRAEGTGRPTGLILDTNPSNPDQVFSVGFAKTPAFFSGALDSSFATIDPTTFKLGFTTVDAGGISNDTASAIQLTNLLGKTPSFLIRFDFRGRWHVGAMTAPGAFSVTPTRGSEHLFTNNTLVRVPYQILLPPKRSAAGKIDLPTGTFLDLDHSPVNITTNYPNPGNVALPLTAGTLAEFVQIATLLGFTQDPATPIAIMFDRENGLGHIFHGTTVGTIRSSMAMLVVDAETEHDAILNPESGSMWVTVNNRSGQVKTSENLGGSGLDVTGDGNVTEADTLLSAAQAAIAGVKAGGR